MLSPWRSWSFIGTTSWLREQHLKHHNLILPHTSTTLLPLCTLASYRILADSLWIVALQGGCSWLPAPEQALYATSISLSYLFLSLRYTHYHCFLDKTWNTVSSGCWVCSWIQSVSGFDLSCRYPFLRHHPRAYISWCTPKLLDKLLEGFFNRTAFRNFVTHPGFCLQGALLPFFSFTSLLFLKHPHYSLHVKLAQSHQDVFRGICLVGPDSTFSGFGQS